MPLKLESCPFPPCGPVPSFIRPACESLPCHRAVSPPATAAAPRAVAGLRSHRCHHAEPSPRPSVPRCPSIGLRSDTPGGGFIRQCQRWLHRALPAVASGGWSLMPAAWVPVPGGQRALARGCASGVSAWVPVGRVGRALQNGVEHCALQAHLTPYDLRQARDTEMEEYQLGLFTKRIPVCLPRAGRDGSRGVLGHWRTRQPQ